jgi:hypothetical protein
MLAFTLFALSRLLISASVILLFSASQTSACMFWEDHMNLDILVLLCASPVICIAPIYPSCVLHCTRRHVKIPVPGLSASRTCTTSDAYYVVVSTNPISTSSYRSVQVGSLVSLFDLIAMPGYLPEMLSLYRRKCFSFLVLQHTFTYFH